MGERGHVHQSAGSRWRVGRPPLSSTREALTYNVYVMSMVLGDGDRNT